MSEPVHAPELCKAKSWASEKFLLLYDLQPGDLPLAIDKTLQKAAHVACSYSRHVTGRGSSAEGTLD